MCSERQKDKEDLDPSQRLLDSSGGAQRLGVNTEPFPERYPSRTKQNHDDVHYSAEGFLRDSLRNAYYFNVGVEGLLGKEGFWFLRMKKPR